MGLFDSDKTIQTQVEASRAYSDSQDNRRELRGLVARMEALEKYIGIEWSESNGKYYKAQQEANHA